MASGGNTLVGSISRIRYAVDGFMVAEVELGDFTSATIIGPIDSVTDLQSGVTYRFLGGWETHQKYGDQFRFATFIEERPHTKEAITKYLRRFSPGIGTKTAELLWDKYGDRTIDLLQTNWKQVVADGLLSEKVAEEAAKSLVDVDGMQRARIELFEIFDGKGVPGASIEKCIELMGGNAAAMIRKNPFILLDKEIPGIGYLRADRLWRELGLPLGDANRAAYCAWHLLRSDGSGHTWVRRGALEQYCSENLSGFSGVTAVEEAIKKERLVSRDDYDGSRWVAITKRANEESELAGHILRLMMQPATLWPDVRKLKNLTDHQRQTLASVLHSPFIILTGPPGSGKTFTAASLITAIVEEIKNSTSGFMSINSDIAVCAPTGKAAIRITELLNGDNFQTDLIGSTVHSLLSPEPTRDRDGGWMFRYNQDNQMTYKLVIIDEFSMASIDVMNSLLRACPTGCHLLFIGDTKQLPPVGHGAPLRDMVAAGVPVAELKEIQRNAGAIVSCCKDIREGKLMPPCDGVDDPTSNLRFIESRDSDETNGWLIRLCDKANETGSAFNDVQVITEVNARSPLGCLAVNKFLQNHLNYNGYKCAGNRFRVGDKILCTKNGMQPTAFYNPKNGPDYLAESYRVKREEKKIESDYVANGEIGRVIAVSNGITVAVFNPLVHGSPHRRVLLKTLDDTGEDDSTEEGRFELGYCITVHKYQGSESPIIAFIVDDSPAADRIGCRELVYTAISRAKKFCFVIGNRKKFDKWCQRTIINKRLTNLKFLLEEGLKTSW